VENKLWVKIVFEKKRGGFNRLMEAMNAIGFELVDTTVTTSKGAMLVSSCVKVSKNKVIFICLFIYFHDIVELYLRRINSGYTTCLQELCVGRVRIQTAHLIVLTI